MRGDRMAEAEDIEWIARCLQGDGKAWDALFDRHYPATAAFIHQLSPGFSDEDVEEIAQETFLAVVRHLGEFEARSSLQTWICRIAQNKARDFLARESAAKRGGGRKPLSLDQEDPATGLRLDPPGTGRGPADDLEAKEEAGLLRQALDALGDPCREVVELRYFADLSYEEIAGQLKLNPKTVSSRLSKCLDRLGLAVDALRTGESSRISRL